MRLLTVMVVIACGLIGAPIAQAQRLSDLRSAPISASREVTPTPASLGAPAPWAQGVRAYGLVAFGSETTDSGSIRPTHWVLGAVIGGTIFGILGADFVMGLGDSKNVLAGLGGFTLGAMIGFPVGALIGGQFRKH